MTPEKIKSFFQGKYDHLSDLSSRAKYNAKTLQSSAVLQQMWHEKASAYQYGADQIKELAWLLDIKIEETQLLHEKTV